MEARTLRLVVLAAVLVAPLPALAGCYDAHGRPPPPCAQVYFPLEGALERVDELDLLLLVDNSNSMAGEQELLARELPRMFRALASGDLDDDGLLDFRPYASLHVGVVTSDMGAGPVPAGESVPSCDAGLGDDGILRTLGRGTVPGCEPSYPPVFEFASADETPAAAEAFAGRVSCVANMGTGGCGFEQPLEAVLKAVTPGVATAWTAPGYVPPVFAGGGAGHADGANAGFLRPSSVLAVVLLSDEEDCSVPDYSILYRDPRFTSVGLNLRCYTFGDDWLYGVERYVTGLRGLRRDAGRLVFSGIVGVPVDLGGDTTAAYARMLADPRMAERPDTSASPPTRLLSSCVTADGGEAFPPRRIVSVADGLARLGAVTTIQSICAGDFRPAIERITTLIAEPGGCLPREIDAAPDGTSACALLMRLPGASAREPVTTCATLGLEPGGVDRASDGVAETHELCVVPQIAPEDAERAGGRGVGWYHDTTDDGRASCGGGAAGRVALSGMSRASGASWYLACPHGDVVELDGTLPVAPVGARCGARYADGAVDCELTSVPSGADGDGDGAPDRLACDLVTSTCVARCRETADCEAAGLLRYRCDTTPIGIALGLEETDPAFSRAPRGVCVRDTCE